MGILAYQIYKYETILLRRIEMSTVHVFPRKDGSCHNQVLIPIIISVNTRIDYLLNLKPPPPSPQTTHPIQISPTTWLKRPILKTFQDIPQ